MASFFNCCRLKNKYKSQTCLLLIKLQIVCSKYNINIYYFFENREIIIYISLWHYAPMVYLSSILKPLSKMKIKTFIASKHDADTYK